MTVLLAPVGSMEGRRRPLRAGHVLVTLEDLLIVTWYVPEATLRASLPPELTPWLEEGQGRVSAVVFRNRALRPAFPGWPRIGCIQMNLRAYLRDPVTGLPGSVFFFGLHLSAAWLARLSAVLFGVPFGFRPLRLVVECEGERLLRWQARSDDGAVALAAEQADAALGLEQLDLLTNPHTGYVRGRAGARLHSWSIWHRNQELRTMSVEGRVAELDHAGLALGPLHSALYVRSVDYEVYL